jgi:hypothetical protein
VVAILRDRWQRPASQVNPLENALGGDFIMFLA